MKKYNFLWWNLWFVFLPENSLWFFMIFLFFWFFYDFFDFLKMIFNENLWFFFYEKMFFLNGLFYVFLMIF